MEHLQASSIASEEAAGFQAIREDVEDHSAIDLALDATPEPMISKNRPEEVEGVGCPGDAVGQLSREGASGGEVPVAPYK